VSLAGFLVFVIVGASGVTYSVNGILSHWAILSEAGMRTTRRKMSKGIVGNAYLRGLTLAF
jgi:hypothetical protein